MNNTVAASTLSVLLPLAITPYGQAGLDGDTIHGSYILTDGPVSGENFFDPEFGFVPASANPLHPYAIVGSEVELQIRSDGDFASMVSVDVTDTSIILKFEEFTEVPLAFFSFELVLSDLDFDDGPLPTVLESRNDFATGNPKHLAITWESTAHEIIFTGSGADDAVDTGFLPDRNGSFLILQIPMPGAAVPLLGGCVLAPRKRRR